MCRNEIENSSNSCSNPKEEKEMGIENCQIFFDNPNAAYYPGQTVNGYVQYAFNSPKTVKGIKIKFLGECHTSWERTETKKDTEGKEYDETVQYEGQEEFFRIEYNLLGGSGEIQIPAGSHNYPFTLALPPSLPSSFEGTHGYVRYTVKTILDRPWKFDQEHKAAFTVVGSYDLNENNTLQVNFNTSGMGMQNLCGPAVSNKREQQIEKTFCCLCCASGPLFIHVEIPYGGYVPGQTIEIKGEIDNASNVSIDCLYFTLKKKVVCHSQRPSREHNEESTELRRITHGGIAPNSSENFSYEIQVPPLPPSKLDNCNLIEVQYHLWIDTEVSGCHDNSKECIPIEIGTKPLNCVLEKCQLPAGDNAQQTYVQPPMSGQLGFMPPTSTSPITQQPIPYPPGDNIPYSPTGQAPYPQPGQPPYPQSGQLPYPQPGQTPYPQPGQAPYPQPGQAPYPTGNQAPYTPFPSNAMPSYLAPSFVEGQFRTTSIQDRHDNDHINFTDNSGAAFAPKYPVFNFSPSAPPPPS